MASFLSKNSYRSDSASGMTYSQRSATVQSPERQVRAISASSHSMDAMILPRIVFREGDEELRDFPSHLREQLIDHVRSHMELQGTTLLWGVGRKAVMPLFKVNNASAHYRSVDGRRLLAARYRYGNDCDITVVKERSDEFSGDGKAMLLAYKSADTEIKEGRHKYRRVLYHVWRPDRDVKYDSTARKVHRYIEIGGDDERSQSEDSDFVLSAGRRPVPSPPFHFKKLEGDLGQFFPIRFKQEIERFVEKRQAWPSCARRMDTGRGLWSTDGKLVQYRGLLDQRLLQVGRYECHGRRFDVVRLDVATESSPGRTVLLGACAGSRGDFKLEDDTLVCVTYYHTWNGSTGKSGKVEIQKWTFQSTPRVAQVALEQYPKRKESRPRYCDEGSADHELDTQATSNRLITMPRPNMSPDTFTPAARERSVMTYSDAYTDGSGDEKVIEPRQKDSAISSTPRRRTRSNSNSPLARKRRRDDALSSRIQRSKISSLPKQNQFDTPLPKDVVSIDIPQARNPLSEHTLESATLIDAESDDLEVIEPESECATEPEPALEHFFIFKINLVDEDKYPPKSDKVCDDVTLLFQHAIQAGIADKKTTLLVIHARKERWSVVRGDSHEFNKVLESFQKAQTSQRVVVTPDLD